MGSAPAPATMITSSLGWPDSSHLPDTHSAQIIKMGGLSSVSISITSAVVYGVFGAVFFLLIFLLVLLGVTDCNWDCNRCWCWWRRRKSSSGEKIDWKSLDLQSSNGSDSPRILPGLPTTPAPSRKTSVSSVIQPLPQLPQLTRYWQPLTHYSYNPPPASHLHTSHHIIPDHDYAQPHSVYRPFHCSGCPKLISAKRNLGYLHLARNVDACYLYPSCYDQQQQFQQRHAQPPVNLNTCPCCQMAHVSHSHVAPMLRAWDSVYSDSSVYYTDTDNI